MNTHGPYETEAQAYLDCEHVYDARTREPGLAHIAKIEGGLLYSACRSAGVSLGAYDRKILGGLADRDPEDVQVLIGLIERAYAAGRDQLAEEMAALHARLAVLETAARHAAPIEIDPTVARHAAERRATR